MGIPWEGKQDGKGRGPLPGSVRHLIGSGVLTQLSVLSYLREIRRYKEDLTKNRIELDVRPQTDQIPDCSELS